MCYEDPRETKENGGTGSSGLGEQGSVNYATQSVIPKSGKRSLGVGGRGKTRSHLGVFVGYHVGARKRQAEKNRNDKGKK